MEGRTFMRFKRIFKAVLGKIYYLIYPDNPTFREHNYVQETKVFQSLKENLTNIAFWRRKETSVTAMSIITKSFEFNRVRELMEEDFSQLVEEKSAYVSKGGNNW